MIKSVRKHVATLDHSQDNLSLLFNRMCSGIDEPENKEHGQKDAVLTSLSQGYTSDGYIALYKYALKQWRRTMEQEKDVVCFEMEVASPLIVGKGDQNVHEFGIILQLPWGTPVIPGSSIKGVLSTFAHEQGGKDWQKSVWAGSSGDLSLVMFGGMSKEDEPFAGALDFFDAWWLPSPDNTPFTEDIINAHNGSFYKNGESWPDGMDSPNPVKFIVVKPGEKFLFAVKGVKNWRNLAKEMLVMAADQYGFGAKTRVGYGRMAYVKSDKDWIDVLPDLIDTDLAGMYVRCKGKHQLRDAIVIEAKNRDYSVELKKIYMDIAPQVCMLHDLEEKPPKQWREVKNIYETCKKCFKKTGVDPGDTDVQKIFSLVLPLAPEELPPWFAAFAPSARDLVCGKSADEIDKLLGVYADKRWPPFADFEDAIKEAELDEEGKVLCLMTFEELAKQ